MYDKLKALIELTPCEVFSVQLWISTAPSQHLSRNQTWKYPKMVLFVSDVLCDHVPLHQDRMLLSGIKDFSP